MQIAHIANMGMGGIARLVTDLANEQDKCGHRVAVYSPLHRDNCFQQELRPSIQFVKGNVQSGYSLNLLAYRRLAKTLRKMDMVHLHAFNALLIIFLFIYRVPCIYTEHGTFQRSHQLNSLKNIIKKRILGRFVLHYFTSGIAFNSEWMQSDARLRHTNSEVIYNGIPLQKTEAANPSNNPMELVYVGRLEAKKRVDLLMETLQYISDCKWCFHIVGLGTRLASLKLLTEQMPIKHNIRFYGQQPNPEEYYKRSQLFLLGSRDEPFGLVILEALKYGCLPLLFADSGGAVEIIESVAPQLIASDKEDMSRKISYWCEHSQERMELVKELQTYIGKVFSVEKMTQNYLQYYQKILKLRV